VGCGLGVGGGEEVEQMMNINKREDGISARGWGWDGKCRKSNKRGEGGRGGGRRVSNELSGILFKNVTKFC
jgi:hypothetical protein